jgi:phage-related protein
VRQRDGRHTTAHPRWRDYRTATGRSPVAQFVAALPREDRAAVLGAMKEAADPEARAARHLEGQIWEVRAQGSRGSYRVLFAQEGARGQILLALNGFSKKTQKTPRASIELAKQRLGDWRRRGTARRPAERDRPLDR